VRESGVGARGPGQRWQVPTRVHSVVDVNNHIREIRLRGPGLAGPRCSPGAHVVVRVTAGTGYARRVYSIWLSSPQHALAVLRLAMHGDGAPGCVWARTVKPGDDVVIEPPRSKITIDPAAAFHLFAGDETAAVPLLAMHAAIHRSAAPECRPPVVGVFEAGDAGAEVPGVPDVPPLPWVHRGGASAVASPVLLDAVRDLELPAGTGTAYLAGESMTCRLLQRHLVEERGWPRRSVRVQQHWAPGRPGFGAGADEPATARAPAGGRAASGRRPRW